ncbi:tRNA 2-selenouridine(34) synthase MnmH [Bdellovibrio sp. HCB337]|uniref:tRNA 2-selenouridine(34) synthase MnmH n=1 Tax=Bdellovibrio sp. HCB337 TaxID=3394358 RepID=UPI0039A4C34A
MSNISEPSFFELFRQGTPLIDVRAPVEFAQGALPGAINLPIMYDEERAHVGTTYKQAGREAAITLGHELISGKVKELRMKMWAEQIRKEPQAVLYCFRGGLRSQITQGWLKDAGIDRPLIVGGYKKARNFLRQEIEQFSAQSDFVLLSGPTGSAKTHILNQAATFYPSVDLEAIAHHRGSAFGAWAIPQPTQIDFENKLAVNLLKLKEKAQGQRVLFEDESRLIGHCALPESVFAKMRASEVIFIEESFDQRVENIYQDYVANTALGNGSVEEALRIFTAFRRSVRDISKKLGGLRAQEVLQDLAVSESEYLRGRNLEVNKAWIAKLLSYYYDPFYQQSWSRRQPRVHFRGSGPEVLEHLRNFRAGC